MKPHNAPQMKPASAIAAIMMTRGVSAGRSGNSTTALAPHAPRKNWPSAPMFHSRMRNANAQARPTRISGVALTNVSLKTPRLPNAASTICSYDRIGSPPAAQITTPPMMNATTRRTNGGQRRQPAWHGQPPLDTQLEGKSQASRNRFTHSHGHSPCNC